MSSFEKDQNFWTNFWNNNPIIKKPEPQLKVGRTINGVPINENLWNETISFLSGQLELNTDDKVLDIAAGCGLISVPFSKKVNSLCAVDISEELTKSYGDYNNITKIISDIRDCEFKEGEFTKVIFYFALQFLTMEESVLMLEKIYKWLSPGGIAYIGDIPDIYKMFDYFNTLERESQFFNSLKNRTPIIGTWYSRKFLQELGGFVGFENVEIINQPSNFFNAHYRFDVKLFKK